MYWPTQTRLSDVRFVLNVLGEMSTVEFRSSLLTLVSLPIDGVGYLKPNSCVFFNKIQWQMQLVARNFRPTLFFFIIFSFSC